MKTRISKTTSIVRTIVIVLWASIVLACVGTYLADPSKFSAENIAEFLRRFSGVIWLIYLAFSVVRGITLLPSTPLVLAGTLLFPEHSFAVLLVSMTGIMLSSTMIYYFSDYLGFSDYFEDRKPELSHKIKAKLEHPLGFLFVAGWAFFPLVPTDLVCYLAGTTKMKYWKFISAVLFGELILCTCYIFFGGTILKSVR